ncbi:MAG: DUF3344 domain-containing protein [Verrucomicrobiae bacterium]|nr:DUF3344 domain-containing protein [Verrucomicrobiae bacterium]
MKTATPSAPRRKLTALTLAFALGVAGPAAFAAYNHAGVGLQTVISGTVSDGALYMSSQATWTNSANPAVGQPYTINTSFTMPSADDIVNGRLVLTAWGGTSNYTANLDVTVNGNPLVSGGLAFGKASDTNATFSVMAPSVYGSGSGVWLIGLPINPAWLNTNGSANSVSITVTTPDSFDGRISQISLLSVYQAASLNNRFQYAIAEGSADIYRAPTGSQTNAWSVSLGALALTDLTSATLHAVYTYGDAGQNDRLYFNGSALGGSSSNNVAHWAPNPTGLSYGPDAVNYDVLSLVEITNSATFSVGPDVPGTRETSLRAQIAVLEITAIPEPNASVFVVLGIGLIGVVRRRAFHA